MADTLSSLRSVEGLDELIQQQQTPSPTYKPRNPVRSCRKGVRALAPKKRRNSTAGDGPTENLTSSNYLLSCSEKALCLKHISECTQTVRGNVLQEEKRSVGVQVDSVESNNFFFGKLETNHLDFDDRDEVLVQKEEENELSVVRGIEIYDKGGVDASLKMQKVQDSSNSCKPVTNNMDQKVKVVNDDVEIVTDECTVPTGEIHVNICIKASSLENVQVNSTSQESGLKSTDFCEQKIGCEGIDLDSNLNNVPHEYVLGDNMDHSSKEIEHKEETHSQNLIQEDGDIYLKNCNDTSSLQNVQEATLPQIVSPKNIFEASSTIGIELVNCLEYAGDEKMSYSGSLNENRKADGMEKVNGETHFETVISKAKANRCLDNIRKVQEASPSFTTEVNKLNTSMNCSVLAKNEVDGGRECNDVQVTTSLRSPSLKGVSLESDINVGSESIYVKGCIDTSALQNVQANTTASELDLVSANLYLYDQETSVLDIDLNSALKSDRNERGGSSSVPCINVPADDMDVMNEESELNVETHSRSLIQEDQDIHSKDRNGTSCLQDVQIATQLQIPSTKNIILEAPSIVANDLLYGLKCDRNEKMQYRSIPSESRKISDMEKVNKETHFETIIISDTEADGCLDNVKEVEEADSTRGVRELNVSMVCSALEHDDVLAKNDEDGGRKCNSVQAITLSERPSPKCIIFEPDSNVGTVTVTANGCIDTSTLQNDEVNSTSQETDLKITNLSLHGQQISIGGRKLNLDLNSDKNERGGSSSLENEEIKAKIDAPNEENEHEEEEQRQHFIQKDQDINVKECYGTSSLQNVQINTMPQIPSPNRIILVADSIVGVDSVRNMGCDMDDKMLSSDSSILRESLKVDGCLDNVKEVKDSSSSFSGKIHKSDMSMVCSALKHNASPKNGNDGERKCKKGSGEGMPIEINTEPLSNKKRRQLSDLSLRKLRLMYKENKEMVKLKMERETEKDVDICCKEETSKKEESANISCKEEPSMKEESGGICWKEETNKEEEFGDISLRKLRFMLKNMAKKH